MALEKPCKKRLGNRYWTAIGRRTSVVLIVAKQVRQRSDPSGVDLPGPFGFSPAVEQTFVDPAAIANKNVRQSRLRDNVVGVRPKTCDVTSGWPVRTRPLARRTPTRG